MQRQHEATRQVVQGSSFAERLQQMGFLPVTNESPAALVALIRRDTPARRQLVESSTSG